MFQTASKDYFFFRFPPLKIASYNPLIDAPPTQPPMGSLQGSRQSFRRQSQEPLSLPHRPRQYKVRARPRQRYLEHRLKTDGPDHPRPLNQRLIDWRLLPQTTTPFSTKLRQTRRRPYTAYLNRP